MPHEARVGEEAGVKQSFTKRAGSHALQGSVLAPECDERVDAKQSARCAFDNEFFESGMTICV
jgi:hypothetical protein